MAHAPTPDHPDTTSGEPATEAATSSPKLAAPPLESSREPPRESSLEPLRESALETPLGVPAIAPREPPAPPRDEAESIVRAASPRRLVLRAITLAGALVITAGAVQLLRARARALEARATVMVSIPGGTLSRGAARDASNHPPSGLPNNLPSGLPAYPITVASFRIDRTEVTVAAYHRCLEAGGCTPPSPGDGCTRARDGRDDHPITCVDWRQASAYCAWAGKQLPTEEEWEYAARGGDGRRFPWGDAPPDATRLNACDATCRKSAWTSRGAPLTLHDTSDGFPMTAPVGRYPHGDSPFGVKDLAGNVAEWTASPVCPEDAGGSAASADLDRCTDPRKVVRGGAWSDAFEASFEATARQAVDPSRSSASLGFRCAKREAR